MDTVGEGKGRTYEGGEIPPGHLIVNTAKYPCLYEYACAGRMDRVNALLDEWARDLAAVCPLGEA